MTTVRVNIHHDGGWTGYDLPCKKEGVTHHHWDNSSQIEGHEKGCSDYIEDETHIFIAQGYSVLSDSEDKNVYKNNAARIIADGTKIENGAVDL